MQKQSGFSPSKIPLKSWLRADSPIWPAILLLTVMLLAGCHTQPTVPCKEPAIPTAPVLRQPLPKESYSISVQRDLSKWQQVLTDTPAMSKP